MTININSEGLTFEGYVESWHVICSKKYGPYELFLLENEEYGDEEGYLVVDCKGNVIMDDVVNGFSDLEDHYDEYSLDYKIWGIEVYLNEFYEKESISIPMEDIEKACKFFQYMLKIDKKWIPNGLGPDDFDTFYKTKLKAMETAVKILEQELNRR